MGTPFVFFEIFNAFSIILNCFFTQFWRKAKGKKFLLVDDLLATGGTANAALELIKKAGGDTSCFLSLIELTFLNGREKIQVPMESLIQY